MSQNNQSLEWGVFGIQMLLIVIVASLLAGVTSLNNFHLDVKYWRLAGFVIGVLSYFPAKSIKGAISGDCRFTQWVRWVNRFFASRAACSKDENKLDRAKLKRLKERIATGKPWVPNVGEYIYVGTHMYYSHSEDNVVGGLAEVTSIKPRLRVEEPSTLFVKVAQHPNDWDRNWSDVLVKEQAKLMKEFGTKFAYPDPAEQEDRDPW